MRIRIYTKVDDVTIVLLKVDREDPVELSDLLRKIPNYSDNCFMSSRFVGILFHKVSRKRITTKKKLIWMANKYDGFSITLFDDNTLKGDVVLNKYEVNLK